MAPDVDVVEEDRLLDVAKLLTRTCGDRTVRSMRPPEMMQPSDTSESVAMPMRAWPAPSPGSAKTNFAGGSGRVQVRSGQRGL